MTKRRKPSCHAQGLGVQTERESERARSVKREGAVMVIVMFVLLMATATAVFAIHATSFEVRAAGHMRRAMQTQYVGESGLIAGLTWVDRWGPQALLRAMAKTSENHRTNGDPTLNLAPFHEPELATGKDGYRLRLQDLTSPTLGNVPLEQGSMGTLQSFEPEVYLDVYDSYTWTGVIAGQRSDGYGRVKYMRATYTSRGRTRVAAGDFTSGTGDRPYHEGASDARAHGLTGPYGG